MFGDFLPWLEPRSSCMPFKDSISSTSASFQLTWMVAEIWKWIIDIRYLNYLIAIYIDVQSIKLLVPEFATFCNWYFLSDFYWMTQNVRHFILLREYIEVSFTFICEWPFLIVCSLPLKCWMLLFVVTNRSVLVSVTFPFFGWPLLTCGPHLGPIDPHPAFLITPPLSPPEEIFN